jgi:hypothetical protein
MPALKDRSYIDRELLTFTKVGTGPSNEHFKRVKRYRRNGWTLDR